MFVQIKFYITSYWIEKNCMFDLLSFQISTLILLTIWTVWPVHICCLATVSKESTAGTYKVHPYSREKKVKKR